MRTNGVSHRDRFRILRWLRSIWFSVAVLVTALLAVAWHIRAIANLQTVKLPDGRVLTIQKITFGTEHKLSYGSLWSRLIAPAVPAKWKNKTGARDYIVRTAVPSLMIWGQWEFPPKGANPAPWGVLKADADDAEVRPAGSWVGVPAKGQLIMAWNAENFPRRAKTFRFEVCEFTNGAFKAVAQFDLPNPARRKYPVWQPQPLPISRQTNGLTIEIANFGKGAFLDEPWLSEFGRPLLRTGYVGVVRMRQDGRVLDNWQVNGATVLDATGNRTNPRVPPSPSIRVGEYLIFGLAREYAPLWPSEHAWKLIPQFTRTAGFASNELCFVSGVPVPTSSIATQIVADVTANGLTLSGIQLRWTGTSFSPQRIRQNIELQPLLSETRPDRHIGLFEVTDNHGRHLRHDQSYFNVDGKHFGIEVLTNSQTLDLTFAIQKPVTIDFTVGLPSSPPTPVFLALDP
jgi:hypothetical protein